MARKLWLVLSTNMSCDGWSQLLARGKTPRFSLWGPCMMSCRKWEQTWVWDHLRRQLAVSDILGGFGDCIREYVVTSCKSYDGVDDARDNFQQYIVESKRSFQMGRALTAAQDYVIERRRNSGGSPGKLIASATDVARDLQKICKEDDPYRYLLPVLEKMGEILWRTDEFAGVLRDKIVFDPHLVIDLVKEVVNHNRSSSATSDSGRRLREEGFLSDQDLVRGGLWGQLSPDRKLAFKKWLVNLDVAYPADGGDMQTDSDLIVPAHWTICAVNPSIRKSGSTLASCPGFTFVWTYEIPGNLSEIVFKNFAVRSYHPNLTRRVSWSAQAAAINTDVNEHIEVRVTLDVCETVSRDVIRIQVGAADEKNAVTLLQYFVVKMEGVLAGYRGANDHVERKLSVADHENKYVSAIQKELEWGRRTSWPYEEKDFLWYEDWHTPATMRIIRKQLADLQNQIARGDRGSRVPGRWTVCYSASEETIELKMLSDEPPHGCHHDPIRITIRSLRQHGAKVAFAIENGIKLLTDLPLIPEPLVNIAADPIVNEARRAEAAHVIMATLGLRDGVIFNSGDSKFSEEENENLLIGLLKLAGEDVAVDGQIQRICNLQCKFEYDRFVWIQDNQVKWDLALEIINGGDKDYTVAWEILSPSSTNPIARDDGDSSASLAFPFKLGLNDQLGKCELRVVVKRKGRVREIIARPHEATAMLQEKKATAVHGAVFEGILSPNSAPYQVRYELKSSV